MTKDEASAQPEQDGKCKLCVDGCIACDARAQPEERNFCPRCGKRTADLTTIHTCTPPLQQPR